jgi:hypothetical protein
MCTCTFSPFADVFDLDVIKRKSLCTLLVEEKEGVAAAALCIHMAGRWNR